MYPDEVVEYYAEGFLRSNASKEFMTFERYLWLNYGYHLEYPEPNGQGSCLV